MVLLAVADEATIRQLTKDKGMLAAPSKRAASSNAAMKALAVMGPMLGTFISRFATGSSATSFETDRRRPRARRRALRSRCEWEERRRHGGWKRGPSADQKGLGAADPDGNPSALVIARAIKMARVRLSVNSRRTLSIDSTIRCRADRR